LFTKIHAGLGICMFWHTTITLLLSITALASARAQPPRFELRPGDSVVLLGSGLIEQERRHAYLEMRLRRRASEGSLTFRNLGWAGDTVRGSARTGGYQNPEGFARLLKEVQDYQPTVLFIGYGTNESFDGPAGLPVFRDDYARLLAKLTPLKARVVLLAPTLQEDLGRPFPDPAAHNRDVAAYAATIRKLAKEHQCAFVDFGSAFQDSKRTHQARRLTTNSLQLNDAGSDLAAHVIEEQLALPANNWRVHLNAAGKILDSKDARVEQVDATKDGMRFQATAKMLPAGTDTQFLRVDGLAPGDYVLQADGRRLLTKPAARWQQGFSFTDPAMIKQAEDLRRAIVTNNELFYRRWRPFNDHSRHWDFIGGDGKLYDRDITAQEKIIAERRRPRSHLYEIIRIGDSK
jgi:hypothetical protein